MKYARAIAFAALVAATFKTRAAGREVPVLGLIGGDLCRTMGGPGDRARLTSDDARTYPIDLGVARVDGVDHLFVAHVIARRSWWRGRVVAVMNAQWLGSWDLGPKSHPNDGLLDCSDGDISLGDRLKARGRLATGTHVPHPGIITARTRERTFTFDRSLHVWIDGIAIGSATTLEVSLEPDALRIVI